MEPLSHSFKYENVCFMDTIPFKQLKKDKKANFVKQVIPITWYANFQSPDINKESSILKTLSEQEINKQYSGAKVKMATR